MTFSSDGSRFPEVPHIEDDEKAFGTRTPNTSPGKQLQSLTDRTEFLANKLAIDKNNPNQASILDLLLPLSGLLDNNGKLPVNRILATDDQGNLTTIAVPSVSFTRVSVANFTSSITQFLNTNAWTARVVDGMVSTKPTGIQEDWIGISNGRLLLNSPGQYLISVTGIGAMIDAHQLRLNVNNGESIFNGICTQTGSAAVGGHTILTATKANAAFTLGVAGAPPIPALVTIEHWCARARTTNNPFDVGFGGRANTGFANVFLVGTVVHTAIQTVKITDNRALITDFNT